MKRKPFTLLELSAAMAVLTIFMFFIMRFFSTSQDVMNRSTGKVDQYEQARVIMELLASDLQNIYYTEGLDEAVYLQTDSGSNTQTLSFYSFRPQKNGKSARGNFTKTDLTWITYSYDSADYTLKMGIEEDDGDIAAGSTLPKKWGTALSGSDLGLLADGVFRFRVIPLTHDDQDGSTSGGTRRIPDKVKIELQLMDGDTSAAIKQLKQQVKKGVLTSLPDTMDPEKSTFKGKDKIRSFFRIVEIDRGQF